MNNAVFGETMESLRKWRDIRLAATERRRRSYLVSKPNYHTTKFFTEYFLEIEVKNTQLVMNKPVYLGISILQLSKMLMYEFWYDYVKPKYDKKSKLCYMYIDSSIVYIKIDGKTFQKMLKLDLIIQIMN